MNILLRFKQKNHAEAYAHDLQLQVTKRLAMVIIWALLHVAEKFFSLGYYKAVSMTPYDISKMTTIFVLVAGLVILRCNLRRTRKFFTAVNLFLDLCLIWAQFVLYPLVGKGSLDIFTKLGIFAYSWLICISVISTYLAIANWWIKLSIPIIQIVYILVPTIQQEHKLLSPVLIYLACQSAVLYFSYIYIYELFQRKDFLEKRKVYENYEAIMQIFHDIIQGVIIVDPHYNIIYKNRTSGVMFNLAQNTRSLDSLFSHIQVKSITPQLEVMTTERIQTSSHDDSVIYNILLIDQNKLFNRNRQQF